MEVQCELLAHGAEILLPDSDSSTLRKWGKVVSIWLPIRFMGMLVCLWERESERGLAVTPYWVTPLKIQNRLECDNSTSICQILINNIVIKSGVTHKTSNFNVK